MTEAFRIAVFAHNLEPLIEGALCSLLSEFEETADLRVFVLVNGCRDNTGAIVRQMAARDPKRLVPVEMQVGDKCNAWNVYVHEYADDSPAHFFMDGDVRSVRGSIVRMQRTLLASDDATAVAGIPFSGRNRDLYRRYVTDMRLLFGNLYGIRQSQLRWIQERNYRLPFGFAGDDCLVVEMMRTRFPDMTRREAECVVYDPDSGFAFDSLQPYKRSDVSLYLRRLVRYRLRDFHLQEIHRLSFDELPETMDDINRNILARLERQRLWHKPTDLFVRRLLRRWYPTGTESFFGQMLALHEQSHQRNLSLTDDPWRQASVVGSISEGE